MRDVAAVFAKRLGALDSPLSIVVSIHLFAEYLLDRLIEAESPLAREILRDHRTFTFAVKLALVHHMDLVADDLFRNPRRLNSLRNRYAHEIDVDLAHGIGRGFVDRESRVLFADSEQLRSSVRDYPDEGVRALLRIGQVTFGWLHDVVEQHDILG